MTKRADDGLADDSRLDTDRMCQKNIPQLTLSVLARYVTIPDPHSVTKG